MSVEQRNAVLTIRSKLFVSHMLVTGIVVILFSQLLNTDPAVQYLVTGAVLVGASTAAGLCLGRQMDIVAGLELIERAIVDGEKPVGKSQFHRCAERLQGHVQRWSSFAAEGRAQTREIDAVLSLFESDARERRKYGGEAAKQIRLRLSSLGRDANGILRELVACNQEIDVNGKHVIACAQHQNETAIVATRDVESLDDDNGTLASLTAEARASAESAIAHSDQTATGIAQIADDLRQVRKEVNDCEHKVRSMRDHTVEIEGLIQAVNENSAKADMLALNASIESVRAGELGRGFAVVAEEIRKLAKQINASTVTALEQLQLVDNLVEETSGTMSARRDALSQQETHTVETRATLQKAQAVAKGFRDHLDRVDNVSQAQSRRVEEVAKALEDLIRSSDSVRSHVVEGGWKTRSLTELISRLTDILEPLMVSTPQEFPFSGDCAAVSPPSQRPVSDEISANHDNSPVFAS